MMRLLRRLFGNKPEPHYAITELPGRDLVCKCGYHNPWDFDLSEHLRARAAAVRTNNAHD